MLVRNLNDAEAKDTSLRRKNVVVLKEFCDAMGHGQWGLAMQAGNAASSRAVAFAADPPILGRFLALLRDRKWKSFCILHITFNSPINASAGLGLGVRLSRICSLVGSVK